MEKSFLALIVLLAACGKPAGGLSESAQGALADVDDLRQTIQQYEQIDRKIQQLRVDIGKAMKDNDTARTQGLSKEIEPLVDRHSAMEQPLRSKLLGLQQKLEKTVKEHPEDPGVLDACSQFFEIFSRLDNALEDIDKALKHAPNDRSMLVRRANLLRRLSRYAEARQQLERVFKDDPNNPAAIAVDGLVLHALNEFDAAIAKLEAAEKQKGSLAPTLADEVTLRLGRARESAVNWKKELEIRAAEEKTADLPRVKIVTDKGDIVVELFENEAPNAVASFVDLCSREFYNGVRVHSIESDLRVLTGDPLSRDADPENDGTGGPGYTLKDEMPPGYRRHFRGSVSLYRPEPNRNGSIFSLMLRPAEPLDGDATVFGRVIEGMDVVEKLKLGDKIKETTILRKRPHAYRPTVE